MGPMLSCRRRDLAIYCDVLWQLQHQCASPSGELITVQTSSAAPHQRL